jgi:hypothetical protein
MITQEDVLLLFPQLLEIVLLAFVVSRLITFIPSFMLSFVRSIKNTSLIYHEGKDIGKALETKLDEKGLDKSDFGIKTLMNRWF